MKKMTAIVVSVMAAGCVAEDEFDTESAEQAIEQCDEWGQPDGGELFAGLWGHGEYTRGGQCGSFYVVTTADDSVPPTPGMLRYGVEQLEGPTWIVFSPAAFPRNTKVTIDLDQTLYLRDDVTIDGRGSFVSLRRTYDYADADWAPYSGDPSVWECHQEMGVPSSHYGPILDLSGKHNIVLTHLDFAKAYVGSIDDGQASQVPTDFYLRDKDCFDDAIKIMDSTSADGDSNDIWINRSSFRDCGDECISLRNPDGGQRIYATLSGNSFIQSYKGIMIGTDSDPMWGVAVSIYRNRFVNVKMRHPRVTNGYAHVFNNVLEDWRDSGIAAAYDSRVIIEENVFRAIHQPENAWKVGLTAPSQGPWAKRNHFSGVPNPSRYVTSSFPACGSAWYYDCSETKLAVSSMSYSTAINLLRSHAGWIDTANPDWPPPM